jgi:hypothetical protein
MHINAGVAAQIKSRLAQGMSAAEVASMCGVTVDDVGEVAAAQAVAQAQALFDQRLNQAREPKGVQYGYDPIDALSAVEKFHR